MPRIYLSQLRGQEFAKGVNEFATLKEKISVKGSYRKIQNTALSESLRNTV